MTFKSGDMVYLRVTPLKGMQRFHVRGKLAPRYIGPFQIKGKCGEVSYQLDLPPHLSEFHDVFHISLSWKCLQVPGATHSYQKVDHQAIDLNHDLTYRERPICVVDEDIRLTRNRKIKLFKVQWSNYSEEKATWEREDYLERELPRFLCASTSESRGRDSPKGRRSVTPQFLAKSLNCGVS